LSTTEPAPSGARPPGVATRLAAREVLAAAWPLFQVSRPGCLPLALIGVAASGTPGAEAIASGEGRGLLHSGQWWGLYAASTVLMLICYAGILRQQLAFASGGRLGALDSMRRSVAGLPGTFAVLLMVLLMVLVGTVLLVVPGCAALVWLFFAWTAQIDEHLGPLAALRRSIALVRGRFLAVAGIAGAALAAVLVFVLLSGILLAVVMSLAGPGAQTGHTGLSVSRWLMAALLSLPVVYVGAVSVAAWRTALSVVPASPADPAPPPAQ
jgi:hypothetical protein